MPDTISVFAVDPQPITIEGLRHVLGQAGGFVFSGSSTTLPDSVEAIHKTQPHVVLMDHSYGLKMTSHFIADLKGTSPRTHAVLWVAECDESDCFRALQMGARGVLRKTLDTSTLLDCLRTVGRGSVWMEEGIAGPVNGFLNKTAQPRITPREQDVIAGVCRGLRNREIASELGITAGTVKVHLMHIFEKTGVKDRFELAMHGRKLMNGASSVAR